MSLTLYARYDRRKQLPCLAALCAALALASGCRSPAQTELYVDQMASEIRVLEDQLYECDYENRVLHQKYERALAKLEARDPDSGSSAPKSDRLDFDLDGEDEEETESPGDVELGQPAPPDIDIDVPLPPDLDSQSLLLPPDDASLTSKDGDPAPEDEQTATEMLLEEIAVPPGTHRLYEQPAGPPSELRVDPLQSHGQKTEQGDQIEQVNVAVSILDAAGNPAHIEHPVSIALLDPAQNGPAARLGVWTFAADEFAQWEGPKAGDFVVEIPLADAQPQGNLIHCFIRIERDDGEGPHGQAKINLSRSQRDVAQASWLPAAH